MKKIRALLCAALTVYAHDSSAGGFSSFELQTAGKRYAYGKSKAPDGSVAERFELHAGDCPKMTGDCRADRERVERSEQMPASKVGSEYWYHFSVFVPKDWPRTGPVNTKLGQFHQKGEGKPPVLFQLDDNAYGFELSNPSLKQTDPMNPVRPLSNITLKTASQMRGAWTDMLVHARWSTKRDGFIKVWVDGRQKVDLSGPNVDRDQPVYFKYGIYRSFVSRYRGKSYPTLIAWFRDINRGTTRASVERR
ncbi:polysaccharide lyase [Agrobacterium sp. Ap1]|uniref:polysaccharide lyase n=1 Tax=Rhizobium/Agrobacterium group TaxID=227290 RepID=UPI001A9060C4|nr:polysaccharide lyase [Agrobacterium sp. Ap1]MBO0145098.1 polysaccharide lyase [Agrobacterium sp. Ap1]